MGYIAKGSITLDTVNDAYTVSLSKQSCVIHADFDGSNPKLSEAQTTVTVLRGDKVMAFDCVSLTDGGTVGFTIENTNRTSYRIVLTSIPKDSLEGTLQFRITTDDGYTTTIQFSYTVVRESTMLDWIKDWEGGKTKIGGTYIMTPKIFIGRKDEYAEYGEGGANAQDSIMSVPGLTGVYIGPDTESTGLYGYLNSEEIFHLNGTGGMIGGWTIDSYGIQSKNGRLQILSNGKIRAVNEEGDSIWEIAENGEASFAMDNVRFFANGDAEFKGKITSKEGQIGGWTIDEGQLYNVPIGISASGKYIAIANVESLPTNSEWGENHFGWMRGYGGVALYYSSRNNFGFIAYGTGGDNMVFSAGSTNYIAGWNFDTEAIWSGTKNNTTSGYSADGITIGSNGLRGIKWYIDSNGDVSFMNGKITFSAADNGGEIVGWKLNERRLSTNKVALTSDDTSVGLYMSAAANANFNSLASSSLEDFIDSWGGIYLKVKTDSADFAAYDSEGIRLFKIKSGGTSYIAGWRFNSNTLYTGTEVTSGFTATGHITLGPTGLRGYKWRFENDGSGALAGGNISWDKSGNVTFADSVKIGWANLGGTIINSEGVFAGKISADNITAGTISTANIKNATGTWHLNQDGSGKLANGAIQWTADGLLTVKNSNLNNVIISGSVRTPFVDGYSVLSNDGPISISTYGVQNNNCVVIPGTGGGWNTAFTVPFTAAYNGFRVIILNYDWNGTKSQGPISASAPSGMYFYEDGEPMATLKINTCEMVEMIGIGEGSTFKGWLILKRCLYLYNNGISIGEGFEVRAMYLGKVQFSDGTPSLVRQKRWNRNIDGDENKKLYISYPTSGNKQVTVHFPTGTFSSAEKYEVILTGHNDAGANVYACVTSKDADSFTVYTGDDFSFNAGGFTFMIIGTWFWN